LVVELVPESLRRLQRNGDVFHVAGNGNGKRGGPHHAVHLCHAICESKKRHGEERALVMALYGFSRIRWVGCLPKSGLDEGFFRPLPARRWLVNRSAGARLFVAESFDGAPRSALQAAKFTPAAFGSQPRGDATGAETTFVARQGQNRLSTTMD